MAYRRDHLTWAAFGALFAFGYTNALLGPSLPYIRAGEDISYVVAAAHQVAFSIGGGLAGLLSRQGRLRLGRKEMIACGLTGAAVAGLGLGYGRTPVLTLPAALCMGLLATLALIRIWAALADAHGARRAVAMTEGEVAVSLAGIATPLIIGALAHTGASWRGAFAIGVAVAAAAVLLIAGARFPEASSDLHRGPAGSRVQPTLVIVVAIVALEFALSFWLSSYLNGSVGIGRSSAVALVSALYAANLCGRLLASRLAHSHTPEHVLAAALTLVLAGLPLVLAATGIVTAITGIALTGTGIGALFPMTSSLHVHTRGGSADAALGEILSVAAIGQMGGPFLAGLIAQAAGLRVGLIVMLPALTLLAAGGLLALSRRQTGA
ncbi:MAG TPA: MFS transporter [Solirubrobacteraceae bacterium]|nr:MFS transporter [Solirubrobacteraceae bacterium]